jgi:hypothetical protein
LKYLIFSFLDGGDALRAVVASERRRVDCMTCEYSTIRLAIDVRSKGSFDNRETTTTLDTYRSLTGKGGNEHGDRDREQLLYSKNDSNEQRVFWRLASLTIEKEQW